jgi:hypothetical protein
VAVRKYHGTADPHSEVEFREAIARKVPSLNKLLGDSDKDVRGKIFELVGKLANHGEY